MLLYFLMWQAWPLFIFVIFSTQSQILYKILQRKKSRWRACDSNQGPLDGRRRRIHLDMTAPIVVLCLRTNTTLAVPYF